MNQIVSRINPWAAGIAAGVCATVALWVLISVRELPMNAPLIGVVALVLAIGLWLIALSNGLEK